MYISFRVQTLNRVCEVMVLPSHTLCKGIRAKLKEYTEALTYSIKCPITR